MRYQFSQQASHTCSTPFPMTWILSLWLSGRNMSTQHQPVGIPADFWKSVTRIILEVQLSTLETGWRFCSLHSSVLLAWSCWTIYHQNNYIWTRGSEVMLHYGMRGGFSIHSDNLLVIIFSHYRVFPNTSTYVLNHKIKCNNFYTTGTNLCTFGRTRAIRSECS